MSRYQEDEPAHSIPMALQHKLSEAKRWYDEGEQLQNAIRSSSSSGPGSAERNASDVADHERRAAGILEDIVEMCDKTWGFGQ